MSKEWHNMVKNQVNCKYEESLNCYYSKRLLQKLLLLNKYATNKIDFNQVAKAIYYAKKYHGGQKRKTGELFYTHTLEVAYMVSDYLFRTDIIIGAINLKGLEVVTTDNPKVNGGYITYQTNLNLILFHKTNVI